MANKLMVVNTFAASKDMNRVLGSDWECVYKTKPLTGKCFDVICVVPFKTKSTVEEKVYDEYLNQLRTKLKPNGILIIL